MQLKMICKYKLLMKWIELIMDKDSIILIWQINMLKSSVLKFVMAKNVFLCIGLNSKVIQRSPIIFSYLDLLIQIIPCLFTEYFILNEVFIIYKMYYLINGF